MKRKCIFYASIFLVLFLFRLPLVYAATVTAVGQAQIIGGNYNQARLKAIEGAKRAAVEQGVGTLVDSKTEVANFEVLQDKIYSRASGYVTNYTILSEGKTPDGSIYTVNIRADVQTASIKNDLRAVGILMATVGNPRFMAVYVPETKSSAHRNSRVVLASEQAINGVFARKGFIVLDRMFINNVYDEIIQAGRIDIDMDDLSALALNYRADLLLVYDVHATKKVGGSSKYFGGITVEVALRAVAPATADLIAQKSGDLYVRTIKTAGSYYDNIQAAKASDTVGKAVAEALIGDTLAYFQRSVHAGARYDLWFRNFSEEEIFTIVDVIEKMSGFKDRYVRNQSPRNFQLDVNYQGKRFDFQKELFMSLKRQGILFQTQEAKGNRFLLFKAGTDNPFKKLGVR